MKLAFKKTQKWWENCVNVTQWLQSQNRSVYKHWLVVMATGLMISKSLGSQ